MEINELRKILVKAVKSGNVDNEENEALLEDLETEQELNKIASEISAKMELVLDLASHSKCTSVSLTKETLEKIHLIAEEMMNDTAVKMEAMTPDLGLTIQEFTKAIDSGKTCVYGTGANETNFYMKDGLLIRKYGDMLFYYLGVSSEELAKMYVRS